jgi:hypothetical protein
MLIGVTPMVRLCQQADSCAGIWLRHEGETYRMQKPFCRSRMPHAMQSPTPMRHSQVEHEVAVRLERRADARWHDTRGVVLFDDTRPFTWCGTIGPTQHGGLQSAGLWPEICLAWRQRSCLVRAVETKRVGHAGPLRQTLPYYTADRVFGVLWICYKLLGRQIPGSQTCSKSDHTTLAHWQRVQVRSTGVFELSSVRISCGLI